ncbi:MAG: hypothetical protein IJD04_05945 [Desulfovibrionaceae bacterium]|nr:hypothetical protein [Desulfovibrionaceae bacterium]
MARYPCEMFAQFYYSPDLTYEELHQIEVELMRRTDKIFADEGGVHLEFWPNSDSFAVQGQFEEFDKQNFARIAEQIRGVLPDSVRARLLLVDKAELEKIIIYNLAPEGVELEENILTRPFAEEGV